MKEYYRLGGKNGRNTKNNNNKLSRISWTSFNKQKEDDKNLIFEVKVAETDMGKVIGREGKMAGAIRTVMKALGAKESKRITIEFIG